MVFRVKAAQLLEQQPGIGHGAQTHIQIGQSLEREQVETHGGVMPCCIISGGNIAEVRAQGGTCNGQRVFTHRARLIQLMAIEMEAVQRNQRCGVAWRSRPGLLQQGQRLVGQMAQLPGPLHQCFHLRAQAAANGPRGKRSQLVVKLQADSVHGEAARFRRPVWARGGRGQSS